MATKTEPNTLGDGLKWEQDSDYSRKKIIVASGNSVVLLEVVGKITASGKYAPLNPVAIDGTEAAAGIMIGDVDAGLADTAGVIVERDALVATDNLVWPDGITIGQKDAAIAELDGLGIKAVDLA
ncbi:MAG: head decoration protein [Desulforhopalus sp.]